MNILQSAIAFSSIPGYVYLHECGHVAAAKLLFKNPGSKITLHGYGFWGAEFLYNGSTLSSFGQFFGNDTAHCIVSAAGPTVDVLLCIATWSSGLPILTLVTIPYAFQLAIYALSSFYDKDIKSHDFLGIKKYGGIIPFGIAIGLSTSIGFGYCALAVNAIVTKKIALTSKGVNAVLALVAVIELSRAFISPDPKSAESK